MANSDRKIAEGLEHIRQAEKCMKTGLFKWKPDLDGAASEYSKAAVAFKNAKALEQATASYLKCADLQRQGGSAFHAAKSLEAAAMLYKDLDQLDKVADIVQEASNLYLVHGTPDTAAHALDRAAKMIESSKPMRAIELYRKACDVSEGEDNIRQCAEMIGKAGRLYMRLRLLEEAVTALKMEMNYFAQVENHGVINKLTMGLVLVHLHRGDYVAADQAFKSSTQYEGFAMSEEAAAIEQLLDAYDQGDQETADQVVRGPLFRFMENDFTKLARDLQVPGGQKVKSGAASPDEEDEYAGGLL